MDRVVISGYFGFDNCGDEAILAAMVYCFKNIYKKQNKKLQITVLSKFPDLTAYRYQVKAVNRSKPAAVFKVIRKCDLFISGGGSLLQDKTGRKSIPYYLSLLWLAQKMNKKTAVFAQGIGPVSSIFNKMLIKKVVGCSDIISVRDDLSLQFLKKINLKEKNIERTVDPVLVFGREIMSGDSWRVPVIEKKNKRLIGVSVRSWANVSYLERLALSLNKLARQIDGEVILIPMFLKQDLEITRQLASLLSVSCCLIPGIEDPQKMIALFSNLDFLVGVRLHSLIFAAVNQVPFVGLAYDPKIVGFIENFKNSNLIDEEDIKNQQKIEDKLFESWHNRQKLSSEIKDKQVFFQQQIWQNAVNVLNLIPDDN